MAWTPGQQLQGGKYRIQQRLGLGGFGITYLARSQEYGRVVIKTLNDEVQCCPEFDAFQNDFFDEALKMRGCQHRNIVRVHRVFLEKVRHPNPNNTRSHHLRLACIVMEYIEGIDLAMLIEQKGRLSEKVALRYIKQMGQALSVVHEQGLLHRDVKPNNIMVRRDTDEAVLIDFGIAHEFTPNLTLTHPPVFTEGFAPIEQYKRQYKRGAFTDVYALAATLYSLLTGEVPPSSQSRYIRLLESRLDALVPPQQKNVMVSDQVNVAIMKGMAMKSKYRPQSMMEWLKMLGGSSNLEPITMPPQSVSSPSHPPSQIKTRRVVPPPLPPHPESSIPPSVVQPLGPDRRQILKWLGLGSAGMLGVWMFKPRSISIPPVLPRKRPNPNDLLQQFTLNKKVVEVNNRGEIINRYPITVDVFTERLRNGVTFKMVQIPAGRFEMGQTDVEKQELMRQVGDKYEGLFGDERPSKEVTVQSFFMGMVTVTQEVYESVMGIKPIKDQYDSNRFAHPNKPVIGVSWDDAIAFCNALNRNSSLVGQNYRLPSEAEWEYACRAGTTTPFYFGPTLTATIANYNWNNLEGNPQKQTTPVGSFPPNAFGLYDMHGNVWEWCMDHWHENYETLPDDGSAWTEGGNSDFRMMRGGAWISTLNYCRSANRSRITPHKGEDIIGFRLVCSSARTV